MHRSKQHRYSITSSARARRVGGNLEAECLCGLEVDHQLELDWALDGKLARFRALKDAIGIGRRAPEIMDQISSVRQQAAGLSEVSERIDGREAVACRQWPRGCRTADPSNELASM